MPAVSRFVFLGLSLVVFSVLCPANEARKSSPEQLAAEIRALINEAITPLAPDGITAVKFAPALAEYADQVGGQPERFESFAAAARRILSSQSGTATPPDLTSVRLEKAGAALLASLPPGAPDAAALQHRLTAHLAFHHARRAIAAVHYQLFKRGLRLAELLAATYAEKDAVAAWRELVQAAEFGNHPHVPALRAQLKQLETNLKELEEQCCPPDEAIVKERVWQPMAKD